MCFRWSCCLFLSRDMQAWYSDKKIEKICKKYLPVLYLFAIIGKYDMRWLPGQAVKTLASHAGIRGSIPLGVTWIRIPRIGGCWFLVFFCLYKGRSHLQCKKHDKFDNTWKKVTRERSFLCFCMYMGCRSCAKLWFLVEIAKNYWHYEILFYNEFIQKA